jgi:hypothetical protein
MIAIVNRAEVIPMPKAKPTPIVLEPALLVSRSSFASATGKVEPCGYPEMRPFSIDVSGQYQRPRDD